jgi:NAD(P)-dependent dehydrogenase (short-subunit alcohol dehydrogenase family)
MGRLEGRIAVVTSAASGIGLATSKRFAAGGATVVMVDLHEDEVRLAAEDGRHGNPFAADVTKRIDLIALRDHISTSYRRADVLFANAGIASLAPFAEVTEEAFDRTVTTNLKGMFFTVQTLLPVLRDGASVILTASVSASCVQRLHGHKGCNRLPRANSHCGSEGPPHLRERGQSREHRNADCQERRTIGQGERGLPREDGQHHPAGKERPGGGHRGSCALSRFRRQCTRGRGRTDRGRRLCAGLSPAPKISSNLWRIK